MLDEQQNELLTRVGPGAPMGNLLRRYWMPIAGVSEFDELTIKPVLDALSGFVEAPARFIWS